jgi:MoaA/NifB/PqqE/SkfB family radical SAM enzyme
MPQRSITELARKIRRGLPYLQKEVGSRLSLRSGRLFCTPSRYYLIMGTRCNGNCEMCYVIRGPVRELPAEVVLRLIRESKDLSRMGFYVSISGGEPLVYPVIYEALELGHKLGMDIGFTTNGYLLTRENVRRLVASDPFNINVSLESVDPRINESIRAVPGGTRKTIDGIGNLIAEKRRTGSRMRVLIKPTITELNYRSLPDLVRYFGKEPGIQIQLQPYDGEIDGRKVFWVRDCDALGAVFEEIEALRREGYRVIADADTFSGLAGYFRKGLPLDGPQRSVVVPLVEPRDCMVGVTTLFIYPNGDVLFCDPYGPIGNVYQDTLTGIWRGPTAEKVRRKTRGCRIDCQASCVRKISLVAKIKAYLQAG